MCDMGPKLSTLQSPFSEKCGLCSPHFLNMGDKPQNGCHVARETTFFVWTPNVIHNVNLWFMSFES